MPYAILRFAKKKAGAVAACERHNERKKEKYASNPDIELDRTADNYHIVKPKNFTYNKACKQLIKERGCKERENSIRMVETLITASPEFLAELSLQEQREYFTRAVNFMADKIGSRNIISAVVHMDERTPHMHLSFCPITEDGRLSAKEILGNQKKLSQWQTDFHECMVDRWPQLQRGESAMVTGRKHIPVYLYKMGQHLDKQYEEIVKALESINAFNAGKRRDEALKIIEEWIPQVEKFTTEIKKLEPMINEYKQEALDAKAQARNARDDVWELKQTIKDKDNELEDAKWSFEVMSRKLNKQEALLAKVPEDIMKKINPKERERER